MITMSKNHTSTMSSFNNYLKSIPKITLLTYGESSFNILPEIKTSLINYILDNNDKYCLANGDENTRKIIIELENKKMNTSFNINNIIITNGATEGLYLTFKALLKENDEVILFSPYYPEYSDLTNIHNVKKVVVKLDDNYQINDKELVKKITKKTKMILLNTPNNPSGVILNKESLSTISKIAKKYNLYIVLDLVYDALTYDKMTYLQQKETDEKVIIINSLSKSYNLTGWRLGYCIANDKIIEKMTYIKQTMNVCMPLFLQKTIKSSLLLKSNYTHIYKKNVDLIYKTLCNLKIKVLYPQAGFYLFFNIDEFNMTSIEFCKLLAEKFQIGLMPGAYFEKDNYVRISCILEYKKMIIVNKKLKKALIQLKRR